jgi:ABC-type dipeptide/oligopeptide/nickel transport system permease subunit
MQSNNRIWKKFRKNKPAMFAAVFIAFVILLAIFAYPLSPDNSPNANRTAVELATLPPFSNIQFLKKPKAIAPDQTSFLSNMFMGTPAQYELIPIQSFSITQDSIIVQRYLDAQQSLREAYAINTWKNEKVNATNFSQQYIHQQTFYLGTDRYGRDMLSRLLLGARVSLAVGFIAVLLSISIGLLLGAFAGYFGGKTDAAIQWLISVIWAIPTLLLVFAITFALGKGFWQIFIAVGLTMWVGTARLIRGQVMSIKEMEYIQAAKSMGFSSWRIITKHILPNVIGPTIVMAASNFAAAILIEAGLSFLGVGIQPPTPSWGLMIKENYNYLITNKPLLAIVPGLAIMLMVLSFNIIGNALRDAFDVKG